MVRRHRFVFGGLTVLLVLAAVLGVLRARTVLAEQACLSAAHAADTRVRLSFPGFDNVSVTISAGSTLGIVAPEAFGVSESSKTEVLVPSLWCPMGSQAAAFIGRSPGVAFVYVGSAEGTNEVKSVYARITVQVL
jgi:uncharacterized membrane protein